MNNDYNMNEDLIIKLKTYDFIVNSITKFRKENKMGSDTLKKYLNKLNIPFTIKPIKNNNIKDISGKFISKLYIKETSIELKKETPIKLKKETPIKLKKETPIELKKETPIELKKETPIELKKETPIELKKETPIELKKELKSKTPIKTKNLNKKVKFENNKENFNVKDYLDNHISKYI